MGFPSKFDEFIESSNLGSHIRPRSVSAAIGPNGPESAAMVCAMYARAGKSVKLSVHVNTPSLSDMPKSGLHMQSGRISAGPVYQNQFCSSTTLKSHGRSWFDTDSEASYCSDGDDEIFECGNNITRAAETADSVISYRAETDHCQQSVLESSSSNETLPPVISAPVIDFPETRDNTSPQHADVHEGVGVLSIVPITREIFAPNVLPWFKTKRKSVHK
jgi:hypothetical protein